MAEGGGGMRGPAMNIISLDEIEDFWTRSSIYRDLFRQEGGLYVGGRGHGKVHAQKLALAEYTRSRVLNPPREEIPSVDTSKIRWRCAPPTQPNRGANIFRHFEEIFAERFAESSGFAARMEVQLAARINKPSVDSIPPGVGHNVNVVTDRVPPHIAALPEEEQGPALVEAIFERKRRTQE
jgi:hypothetical protein